MRSDCNTSIWRGVQGREGEGRGGYLWKGVYDLWREIYDLEEIYDLWKEIYDLWREFLTFDKGGSTTGRKR